MAFSEPGYSPLNMSTPRDESIWEEELQGQVWVWAIADDKLPVVVQEQPEGLLGISVDQAFYMHIFSISTPERSSFLFRLLIPAKLIYSESICSPEPHLSS